MLWYDYTLLIFGAPFGLWLAAYLIGLGLWHGYGWRAAEKRRIDDSMRDLDRRVHGKGY